MRDYVGGNRVSLLRNGGQYFPALVAAIDAARTEVFVDTVIYADDATGSLVTEALARAAERGVATHLLIDGFGAKDFAKIGLRRGGSVTFDGEDTHGRVLRFCRGTGRADAGRRHRSQR